MTGLIMRRNRPGGRLFARAWSKGPCVSVGRFNNPRTACINRVVGNDMLLESALTPMYRYLAGRCRLCSKIRETVVFPTPSGPMIATLNMVYRGSKAGRTFSRTLNILRNNYCGKPANLYETGAIYCLFEYSHFWAVIGIRASTLRRHLPSLPFLRFTVFYRFNFTINNK